MNKAAHLSVLKQMLISEAAQMTDTNNGPTVSPTTRASWSKLSQVSTMPP